MPKNAVLALIVAAGVILAVHSGAAAVKVKVDFEKTFDFTAMTTWAWSDGVGDIMLARTPQDDPDELRTRAQPVIMATVADEMAKRSLKMVNASPDLSLRYYMLLTIGDSNQQMGQFVPSVVNWGLPMFAPATTSYQIIQKGALVLDMSAKGGQIVWRAVAEANIKMDLDAKKREDLLREAIRESLKKYPPKK
jgi:hypothetical protein